jgi:hypothetical protein
MKFIKTAPIAAVLLTLGLPVHAAFIVNDTWLDSTRTDPTSANGYSENGVDGDIDGNLESSWYGTGTAGTSSFDVISPGVLRGVVGSGSSTWTTYFTPESSPITLASVGDTIRITWVFTPTGIAGDTGQSFRLGIVDSPSGLRVSTDTGPGNGIYPGYAMFMNMNTTLGAGNPFQLMERSTTSTGLLANGNGWVALDDEENSGVAGYANGAQYTFIFTATLNASSGLDISASMTGDNLGGDGQLDVTFTDATPNSLTFDQFSIRPSGSTQTAGQFDTSAFSVEFIPEPSTAAIASLAGLFLIGLYRRARR